MRNRLKPNLGIDFMLKRDSHNNQDDIKKAEVCALVCDINAQMFKNGILKNKSKGALYYTPDSFTVDHEDGDRMSSFHLNVLNGVYSIMPDYHVSKTGKKKAMSSEELTHVTGETDSLDTVLNTLEYILAHYYPSAVEDGRLKQAIENIRNPGSMSTPAVDL